MEVVLGLVILLLGALVAALILLRIWDPLAERLRRRPGQSSPSEDAGARRPVAAGWFLDPEPASEPRLRFWDGTAWTAFTVPLSGDLPLPAARATLPDGRAVEWVPAPPYLVGDPILVAEVCLWLALRRKASGGDDGSGIEFTVVDRAAVVSALAEVAPDATWGVDGA